MPVKIKGKQMKSKKEVRQSVKSSGGEGFITYIGDEGLTVRFQTDSDGWYQYKEHYDEEAKQAYPCVADGCPGCEDGSTLR